MRALVWPSLTLAGALLLSGCGGMGGTSSAGFSSDEDALPAPSGAARLTTGPTYGTTGDYTSLPLRSSQSAPDTADDFDNLQLDSPALKSRLAVLRVGSDRTDSNLLSVFTGLKNRTGHRLNIEVETVYRDKADRALNKGASWVPISLQPHEETQYRSVAISEDATDFLVRIRPANAESQ